MEILMVERMSRKAMVDALWDWDPVGIAQFRNEAGSEYDSLARKMLASLRDGATIDDLTAIARSFVTDLGIAPTGIDMFAKSLRKRLAGSPSPDSDPDDGG
jgi:hypothetical protein